MTMPRIRTATAHDAPSIHSLIVRHLEEGHLLPRSLEEISAHTPRFIVATAGKGLAGCAELAPLSHAVAEVRSLVVDDGHRRLGLGGRLVEEIVRRARLDGYQKLCAFTHDPAYFVRMGFSIVPHVWLPEKISTDCCECPLFRQCGQFAMLAALRPAVRYEKPAERFAPQQAWR